MGFTPNGPSLKNNLIVYNVHKHTLLLRHILNGRLHSTATMLVPVAPARRPPCAGLACGAAERRLTDALKNPPHRRSIVGTFSHDNVHVIRHDPPTQY